MDLDEKKFLWYRIVEIKTAIKLAKSKNLEHAVMILEQHLKILEADMEQLGHDYIWYPLIKIGN
jgi:hypothetical protein